MMRYQLFTNDTTMKRSITRALALGCAALLLAAPARADKGMWLLNELTKENLQQMRELGFKLSSEELYSLDKPSVAGSVVIFGRGCTGVTVSATGLVMTNHHCGYSAIQSQSTVDHDYLRDGFVSQTYAQELPIEGLQVRYLSDIKDITPEILKGVRKAKNEMERIQMIQRLSQQIIDREVARLGNAHKEVIVRPYYAGNKYYMITYDVFNDVRMVFAPPSSIGKFGGDTDNWMWPRHTGDFSVFRVYASPDNKPANYSKDNVPYRPKHHAAISTGGYKEGDYAMTIGFPGSTERYIPSWGIETRIKSQNEPLIEVRGAKQALWRKAMDADQATRIKYSDKYARSSNYWKNSIGMNRGLHRLAVVDRKREEEEAAFRAWVERTGSKEYAGVLEGLEKAYTASADLMRRLTYINEALVRGSEVIGIYTALQAPTAMTSGGQAMAEPSPSVAKPGFLDAIYKDYVPELDRKVLVEMLTLLRKRLTKEDGDLAGLFSLIDQDYGGNITTYVDHIFDTSVVLDRSRLEQAIADGTLAEKMKHDPAGTIRRLVRMTTSSLELQLRDYMLEIQRLNRLYFAGRQAMDPSRPMPSDANFTMRMSYGAVGGYAPSDAVEYSYYTTPKGILEKYTPGSTEFDLKPEFVELLKAGKWGRWADAKSGHMQVAFLSNNDITGGNSGSPVFDAEGRVIGLAFDGNWEAMSGDIEFEPALQRTISVDIRYVLYVIEQWGKCPRLIEELDLR